MSAIEQGYLIKGYLLAQNAPQPIITGVEIIIAELEKGKSNIAINVPADNIGDLVSRYIGKLRIQNGIASNEPILNIKKEPRFIIDESVNIPAQQQKIPDWEGTVKKEPKIDEKLPNDNIESEIEETTPEKKQRKPWSPEARAAAADRMRKRIADGIIGKKKSSVVKIEPRADTKPEQLIERHDEYAGKRDPGQELQPEDWPDIQRMLQKNGSKAHIAKLAGDYDVTPKQMEDFVGQNILREARAKDAKRKPVSVFV